LKTAFTELTQCGLRQNIIDSAEVGQGIYSVLFWQWDMEYKRVS